MQSLETDEPAGDYCAPRRIQCSFLSANCERFWSSKLAAEITIARGCFAGPAKKRSQQGVVKVHPRRNRARPAPAEMFKIHAVSSVSRFLTSRRKSTVLYFCGQDRIERPSKSPNSFFLKGS